MTKPIDGVSAALRLVAEDRHSEAIPRLLQGITEAPADAGLRTALGIALLGDGQPDAAAIQFLKASRLKPAALEPRMLLASAFASGGKMVQAIEVLDQTVADFPSEVAVWSRKGVMERKLGRDRAAAASFTAALALRPEDPDILNNLGVIARAQGQIAAAIAYYRRALAVGRPTAEMLSNLGNALDDIGATVEAGERLRDAVAFDPASIDARHNLAAHLLRGGQPEAAVALLEDVTSAAPARWDSWTNAGVALLAVGRIDEAEHAYRRALALKPDLPEATYDLAWIFLLTGRWSEGWQAFEARWQLPTFASRRPEIDAPDWNGQSLGDGVLLLYAEQGFGDTVQMIRYARLARQRCGQLIVLCPQPLRRLIAAHPDVDRVIVSSGEAPPISALAPLMSLPRIFATTPETIPDADGYLPPPPPGRHCLADNKRRRIGIVWAGSPANKIDRARTCDASYFVRALNGIDADIVNLQVGDRAGDFAEAGASRPAYQCHGRVTDFLDTAEVIGQLDLIIAVDTAVIHVAGALGRPVWLLLPFMPDYRWLLGRLDTPWYQSVRLFRQRKRNDWNQVFGDVAEALTNW